MLRDENRTEPPPRETPPSSRRPKRAAVAAAGALLLAGCDRPEQAEGGLSKGTSPIYEGTSDSNSLIPAVVMVGGCTGTLISPHVVLTAAHCFTMSSTRCDPYNYGQPFADGDKTKVKIPPVDPASPPGQPKFLTDFDDPNARTIDIVGWAPHPGWTGNLVEDCCAGDPANCPEFCPTNTTELKTGNRHHDLALVYLAEPVTNIVPMKVLLDPAPTKVAAPSLGRYPVDLDDLLGSTFAFAGTSKSDADPTGRDRAYGLLSLTTLSYPYPNESQEITLTKPSAYFPNASCSFEDPAHVSYDCDACVIGATQDPSCGVKGDSGGPAFLNATALGADSVEGLSGQTVVAGTLFGGTYGSPGNCVDGGWSRHTGTWDTTYNFGGFQVAGENGTWIRARLADFDGDGVPNEHDNCVVAPNPKQANCNADAEDAWGYPRRGNACDPIPCADTELDPPQIVITASSQTTFFTTLLGRAYRDTFDVRPRTSNEYGNGSNAGDPQAGLTTPSVPTYYSFCQKDSTVGIHCDASDINNQFLDPVEGSPHVMRPYHNARVVDAVAPSAMFNLEILDHPTATVRRTWKFADDFNLWVGEGWIHDSSGSIGQHGWGFNLDGRFWIRSDTDTGRVVAASATGYRTKNDGSASADDQHLSNHYFPLAPDTIYGTASVGALLVTPEIWFPLCDPLLPIWDGLGLESAPVIQLDGEHFAVPLRSGEMADASDYLGFNLQIALADSGVVWATAVEAMPWQTNHGAGMDDQAVAVFSNGSDLAEIALVAGGQIVSLADQGESVTAMPFGPQSREGFVPVYSRVEDRLFVVGGEPYGDVWMRSVRGDLGWEKLDLSVESLGVVEAASYSFFDRRLWVLDRDGEQNWRLFRIQPTTGFTELVGSWEDSGDWDWHRLVLDHDGQMLLVSSSASLAQHAVARLEVTPHHSYDAIRVASLQMRDGALHFAPRVHAAGYTYYRVEDDAYVVELEPTLGGAPTTLDEGLQAIF